MASVRPRLLASAFAVACRRRSSNSVANLRSLLELLLIFCCQVTQPPKCRTTPDSGERPSNKLCSCINSQCRQQFALACGEPSARPMTADSLSILSLKLLSVYVCAHMNNLNNSKRRLGVVRESVCVLLPARSSCKPTPACERTKTRNSIVMNGG